VLKLPVIHPVLLAALARAGHGSTILIADGNYPHETGAARSAERVYLNLRPGLLTVAQALDAVNEVVPLERAQVMRPDPHDNLPLFDRYRAITGLGVELVERFEFYAQARQEDLAVLIATGDQQHYANILLTVGAWPAPDARASVKQS